MASDSAPHLLAALVLQAAAVGTLLLGLPVAAAALCILLAGVLSIAHWRAGRRTLALVTACLDRWRTGHIAQVTDCDTWLATSDISAAFRTHIARQRDAVATLIDTAARHVDPRATGARFSDAFLAH
ncbi:MAG: hypothetical protein RLW62_03705, partial [Gammaproteobacteria bacterium]